MITTVLASVALLASTALAGPGSAVVVNQCSYDVHLSNVPSEGGGYNAVNQILSSGGSYSQVYTMLGNTNGWSIKLSKSENFGSDILQYEYTYHDDGIIWYDLSAVNGNPWDANWEITATGSCTPRQAAYRYSTDDAYGMQSCPDDASITVTLCSGESGGAAPSAPAPAPSTPAYSAPPVAPTTSTYQAPATTSTYQAPATTGNQWSPPGGAVKNVEVQHGKALGKDDKQPQDGWKGPAVTVTNLHYETVTQLVTATAHPKRHVHHARHPHHRR